MDEPLKYSSILKNMIYLNYDLISQEIKSFLFQEEGKKIVRSRGISLLNIKFDNQIINVSLYVHSSKNQDVWYLVKIMMDNEKILKYTCACQSRYEYLPLILKIILNMRLVHF